LMSGGSFQHVDAPLGQTPVFVRAPSIIPKGPVMQHTEEQPLTDVRLHLYRANGTFTTSFTMYEDDGRSFDYRDGAMLRTRITYDGTAAGDRITVQRAEGSWTPPAGRTWTLEMHGTTAAAAVAVNGVVAPMAASRAELEKLPTGWTIADGRIVVRAPDASAPINVEVQFAH
jgi:alpha-glucosidase (family GH31 glycosyl hydrolase)